MECLRSLLNAPTLASECNLQIPTVTLKPEAIEGIDQVASHSTDSMYPSKPTEAPELANYYNTINYESVQLKKEIPKLEYQQSGSSMNMDILHEEIIIPVDIQKVKMENTLRELALDLKKEDENTKREEIEINVERLEEQDILDNTENTSILFKILATLQEFQCKICHKTFKNSLNFLKHSQEHNNIERNLVEIEEMNQLLECQYCDHRFVGHDNMRGHVTEAHKKENPKCDICSKQLKSLIILKRHVQLLHRLKKSASNVKCKYCSMDFHDKSKFKEHLKVIHSDTNSDENESERDSQENKLHECPYCDKELFGLNNIRSHINGAHRKENPKCELCGKLYTNMSNLKRHVKVLHKDKRGDVKCKDCNMDFQNRSKLNKHMRVYHTKRSYKEINCDPEKNQCEICQKQFKRRLYLFAHIRRVHYDYGGRMFECKCGKRFRTPSRLKNHKRLYHNTNGNFQCDYCQRRFTVKCCLILHIRRMHYEYGRTFDCWCGQQFFAPMQLKEHMKLQQHDKLTRYRNQKCFQCDYCQKFFTSKHHVMMHIKRLHYIYGRTFDCSCGELFRTPIQLSAHKRKHYDVTTPRSTFKCIPCKKPFQYMQNLSQHVNRLHTNYEGDLFECWCGHQSRTPLHSRGHKNVSPTELNREEINKNCLKK